jgi:hypothetical protein
MTDTKKPAKRSATFEGFSDEERAAMKDHAKELKLAARRGSRTSQADDESDVLAKIAEMQGSDRDLGERLHALIKATAPAPTSRLWYGMPAYATDGKTVRSVQPAAKFKSRYATLGLSDPATLDDGTMWPTVYAIADLTPATEKRVAALIKTAVS